MEPEQVQRLLEDSHAPEGIGEEPEHEAIILALPSADQKDQDDEEQPRIPGQIYEQPLNDETEFVPPSSKKKVDKDRSRSVNDDQATEIAADGGKALQQISGSDREMTMSNNKFDGDAAFAFKEDSSIFYGDYENSAKDLRLSPEEKRTNSSSDIGNLSGESFGKFSLNMSGLDTLGDSGTMETSPIQRTTSILGKDKEEPPPSIDNMLFDTDNNNTAPVAPSRQASRSNNASDDLAKAESSSDSDEDEHGAKARDKLQGRRAGRRPRQTPIVALKSSFRRKDVNLSSKVGIDDAESSSEEDKEEEEEEQCRRSKLPMGAGGGRPNLRDAYANSPEELTQSFIDREKARKEREQKEKDEELRQRQRRRQQERERMAGGSNHTPSIRPSYTSSSGNISEMKRPLMRPDDAVAALSAQTVPAVGKRSNSDDSARSSSYSSEAGSVLSSSSSSYFSGSSSDNDADDRESDGLLRLRSNPPPEYARRQRQKKKTTWNLLRSNPPPPSPGGKGWRFYGGDDSSNRDSSHQDEPDGLFRPPPQFEHGRSPVVDPRQEQENQIQPPLRRSSQHTRSGHSRRSSHHLGSRHSAGLSPTGHQTRSLPAQYRREVYLNDNYHEDTNWRQRPTRARFVFMLAGIGFVAMSVMAVTKGIEGLERALGTINAGSETMDELAVATDDVLSSLHKIQRGAGVTQSKVRHALDLVGICPGVPVDVRNSSLVNNLRDQAAGAVPLLKEFDTFSVDKLNQVRKGLDDVIWSARRVEAETEPVDENKWYLLLLLVPYTFVPVFLMIGTILAHNDVSFGALSCLIDWLFFPIFFILVVFACAAAAGLASAVSASADICVPRGLYNTGQSVDHVTLDFLVQNGYTSTSFEYEVLFFYLSKCKNRRDPFRFARDFVPRVVSPRF